jgi:HD superfamily phosphodiesterase
MFNDSIQEAQRLLKASEDKAHDLQHAKRVASNVRIIATETNYKDVGLLETCAWWHDVGRLVDDANHEQLSADLVKKDLLERGATKDQAVAAYEAVRLHKWSMQPQTVEGYIIRDADKLDFISVDRWQACLDANQPEHLRDMNELLPKLRSMLYFKESRSLYDQSVTDFRKAKLTDRL